MRVFISWSGDVSKLVAEALRDWLPSVLQPVQPWLSPDAVERGVNFLEALDQAMEPTEAAILCVSRSNVEAPWFNYESGSVSTRFSHGRVFPLLIDLQLSEFHGPAAALEASRLDRDGVLHIVRALNRISERPLDDERLSKTFDLMWPELAQWIELIEDDAKLGTRPLAGARSLLARSSEDITAEILITLRHLVSRIDVVDARLGETSRRDRSGVTSADSVDVRPTEKSQIQSTDKPPRVFIGSSAEGLSVAGAIQDELEYVAECTMWNQGVFKLSETFIEGLIAATRQFDWAVIVLTADDVLTKRGTTSPAPRDNLLFELGLFTGSLGRARTFLVVPRDEQLELPSDLDGVTKVDYRQRADGNVQAAVAPLCRRIKEAMGVDSSPRRAPLKP